MLHLYYFETTVARLRSRLESVPDHPWMKHALLSAEGYVLDKQPELAWRLIGLVEGTLGANEALVDPREDEDAEHLVAWLRKHEPKTLVELADIAASHSAYIPPALELLQLAKRRKPWTDGSDLTEFGETVLLLSRGGR